MTRRLDVPADHERGCYYHVHPTQRERFGMPGPRVCSCSSVTNWKFLHERARRRKVPQQRLSVSVPAHIADWVRETAKAHDVPVSWIVAECLRQRRDDERAERTLAALRGNGEAGREASA